MSTHLERAKELRAITERHYNCAQSVIVPFAKEAGLDEETAYQLAANFGAGMKMGSVCGAVTGALLVLGLLGFDGAQDANKLCQEVRKKHEGLIDCRDLLRVNAERGGDKKAHCDAMVYEAVALVDAMIDSRSRS